MAPGNTVKKLLFLKIFPKLCKTFFVCVYSYLAYFILSLKSAKRVTERNKRLSLFIDKRKQFLIPVDWVIENDLCPWFLHFYQKERVWVIFLRHVLSKLSQITVAFPK